MFLIQKRTLRELKHIKSRITKARIAGFGGWKEYVPSDSKKLKEYEQNLSKANKEKFYECCRGGKEQFITWYVENYYEKEGKNHLLLLRRDRAGVCRFL